MIEYSAKMSKRELEQIYFNHTGYAYKAKRKDDIIEAIKRLNRARMTGKAFAKMLKHN